jgi:hypothetical protein
MKAKITIENNYIRVDLFDCIRPGNIYHCHRGCGGLVTDVGIAVDYVWFHHGIKADEFVIDPAHQWALTKALEPFMGK